MQNILLINAMKVFGHSQGQLNTTLHHTALDLLKTMGFSTQETIIDDGYVIGDEIDKWMWADVIIHQMPGWWMGPPWIFKKYIDEVFTLGHGQLYENDGRTRNDPSKKYGSGGLIQDKRYMLSLTWNAPEEAFTDVTQFFGGVGIDGVYLPVHKAHEFLGMQRLPTFLCADVMKNPDVNVNIAHYQSHLRRVFAN